jgi:hypothetical protein
MERPSVKESFAAGRSPWMPRRITMTRHHLTHAVPSRARAIPQTGVRAWESAVRIRTVSRVAYKSQTALLQRLVRFHCQIGVSAARFSRGSAKPGTRRHGIDRLTIDRSRKAHADSLDLQELDVTYRRGWQTISKRARTPGGSSAEHARGLTGRRTREDG